jgi:hypothetical protein
MGEKLTQEENLVGLAAINRESIAKAETIDSPQRGGWWPRSSSTLGSCSRG